ncbi:MAG: ATP-binding protein, partial [Pseudomonadota bacterium]
LKLYHASRSGQAVQTLQGNDIDVVVLDTGLPDASDCESIRSLQRAGPGTSIVVYTGNTNPKHAEEVQALGVDACLIKGRVSLEDLARHVVDSVERRSAKKGQFDQKHESQTAAWGLFFNDSPVPHLLLDTDSQVAAANIAATKVLGLSVEELAGQHLDVVLKLFKRQAGSFAAKNGARSFEINSWPTNWAGKPAKTVALTPSKHVSAAQAANESGATGTAEHTQFLAHVSHELRTPLNAVMGFAELLQAEIMGPLGHEAYRDYAGMIMKSSSHLLDLINDLLDLSKAGAGKLCISADWFDLVSTIREAVATVSPKAKQDEIGVIFEADWKDFALFGDKRRILQVLLNILDNAIKFSDPGGKVEIRLSSPRQGRVQFEIEDRGAGISSEMLPKVFSAYAQQENALVVRKGAGTGLGLAVTRELVALHEGKIEISSIEGLGTTVMIDLPVEPGKID